jgi:2-oxoglutarate dehydrogenase E2 component (dihydrolipoamide succinyltransferase)
MIEIKVPTVGESISEVTLVTWLKKDGDWVERDELLCELESEKATFELNAEQAGILPRREIH